MSGERFDIILTYFDAVISNHFVYDQRPFQLIDKRRELFFHFRLGFGLLAARLHPALQEVLREFDSCQAQKGTWQELYAVIQEMEPKTFTSLRKHVYELSDHPRDDDEEDEDAHLKTEGVKFLRRTLQRLSDQAARHAETVSGVEETEDVFRGI